MTTTQKNSAGLAEQIVKATRVKDLRVTPPKGKGAARYARVVRPDDKKKERTVCYIAARKGDAMGVVQAAGSKEMTPFKTVAAGAKLVKEAAK
jgi:hypothetical protein